MNLDAKTQTRHCALCGRNCSHVPRVKDRSGRYYCRRCYERASLALDLNQPSDRQKPKRQAPRARRRITGEIARAESANAVSSSTMGNRAEADSQPSSPSCPSCHHELATDAVLCTDCGFDLRSGKKVDSAVVATGSVARTDSPDPSDSRARTLRRVLLVAGLLLIAAGTLMVALLAGR